MKKVNDFLCSDDGRYVSDLPTSLIAKRLKGANSTLKIFVMVPKGRVRTRDLPVNTPPYAILTVVERHELKKIVNRRFEVYIFPFLRRRVASWTSKGPITPRGLAKNTQWLGGGARCSSSITRV